MKSKQVRPCRRAEQQVQVQVQILYWISHKQEYFDH